MAPVVTEFKQVRNFCKTTVVSNELNNTDTTITFDVAAGTGDDFDDENFYVTAFDSINYSSPEDDPNARTGLCTERVDDTFTVTWDGTPTALAGPVTIFAGLTAKNIQDIYDAIHITQTEKQTKVVITVGMEGSGADFICDGVEDNIQLQAAIDYLVSIDGGTLQVLAGLYDIQERVWIIGSNIIVKGVGQATRFRLADDANQEIWLVGNGFNNDTAVDDLSDSGTPCNDVHFYDFYMDGNKANQEQDATVYNSIKYGNSATRNLLRYRSDAQSSYGGVVDNVRAVNSKQNGISSESHAFVTIRNCIAENCDQFGIWFENGSQMLIAGNYTRNNVFAGMKGLSAGAKVLGNESKGDKGGGFSMQSVGGVFANNIAYRTGWQGVVTTPSTGMGFSLSSSLIIANNYVFGSYGHGMVLNGLTRSTIMGNTFRRNGQSADDTYYDMRFTFEGGGAPCTDNVIMGNTFKNDTASFYDNKAKYNIGSDSASAHSGNTFIANIMGEPVSGYIYQMADNTYINHDGVNPIGYHNYGYVNPDVTLSPLDGDFLFATGYANEATVDIEDGSFKGQHLTFGFAQDVGNKQITTWSSNVEWSKGRAPIFSGVPDTRDIMTFVWDGTKWNGSYSTTEKNFVDLAYLDNPETLYPNDNDVIFGSGYSSNTTVNIENGRNKGQQFTFIFAQDVGNKQITWGSNVRWSNGTAPTFAGTANTVNVIIFTWDGTKWNGLT